MTHAFEYLSVMFSIVLGLALAHILGAWARLLRRRREIRFYWPSVVWSMSLFLIVLQVWWADFSLVGHRSWNFASFLVMMSIPAGLYLASYLLLPETLEMEEEYRRSRVPFYGVLISLPLLSALEQYTVDGYVHVDFDTALKAFILIVFACGLLFPGRRAQQIVVTIGAIWTIVYIALLFRMLPVAG